MKEGEKWRCKDSRSFVLLMSTKIPGISWKKFVKGFHIKSLPVPALDKNEIVKIVKGMEKDTRYVKKLCDIWKDYGGEPVGIEILKDVFNKQFDAEQRKKLFEENLVSFFTNNFAEKSFEGNIQVQIMKIVA